MRTLITGDKNIDSMKCRFIYTKSVAEEHEVNIEVIDVIHNLPYKETKMEQKIVEREQA